MTATFERGGTLVEPEASPESGEQLAAMRRLRDEGLAIVRQRFGDEGSGEKLDFHGPEHTEDVVERVRMILGALRTVNPNMVSERDVALGEMIAAWHDAVQALRPKPDGSRERQRGFYAGDNPALPAGQVGNEQASWQELEERMRPIFSAEDIARGQRGIAATFPQFAFETFPDSERQRIPGKPQKGLRVFQPHLEDDLRRRGAEVDRVELAVGLADLGTFGMEAKGRRAMQEGDAEFRELHPEWAVPAALNDEQRRGAAKAMLDWLDSQVGFASWQRIRFEQNIAGLPAQEQTALRQLFPYFEQNIAAAYERTQAVQQRYGSVGATGAKTAFLELAQELGY